MVRRSIVFSVGSSMGAPLSDSGKPSRNRVDMPGLAKSVTPYSPRRWLNAFAFSWGAAGESVRITSKLSRDSSAMSRSACPPGR